MNLTDQIINLYKSGIKFTLFDFSSKTTVEEKLLHVENFTSLVFSSVNVSFSKEDSPEEEIGHFSLFLKKAPWVEREFDIYMKHADKLISVFVISQSIDDLKNKMETMITSEKIYLLDYQNLSVPHKVFIMEYSKEKEIFSARKASPVETLECSEYLFLRKK